MEFSKTDLNPTSLINLKAELQKKYEVFKQSKGLQTPLQKKLTHLKNKGEDTSKGKKKTPIVKSTVPDDDEETLALEKSRKALEAKAKLYEKITSNNILIDDEENDRYLVDFQRKVLYAPVQSENTDKDDGSSSAAKFETPLPSTAHPVGENSSASRKDVKEEKLDSDENIHYQNVQYNEIRDHGTAYFAFSTDETKRKEQMEELGSLRQETEAQILAKQRMQRKRKAMLEARLTKICERRNIDKNVVQAYTPINVQEEEEIKEVDLSSIPLPEPASETSEKKEPKIRPWDVGKEKIDFQPAEKRKIRNQNDWIEERRNERPFEFAPPTNYSRKFT
ncbi:coiled-coil domain-containing protein 174-like [Uloborus diversus]|uniref:coiled-coil domain-containing protein 174-like n=1 Tax=Uloborus diversus TaxID=327109 RepID=UPI00240A5ED2|nr:coiled-coil domain-containing protein 174-like [Uloborus diversus]